jgi:carbonic anhydrase/acetyltransferase-like protein (isoleucine patch superfamily)
MVELVLHYSDQHLKPLLNNNEIPLSSLEMLGQPLLVRNISTLTNNIRDIDTIRIPDDKLFSVISILLQKNFPSINVKVNSSNSDASGSSDGSYADYNYKNKDKDDKSDIKNTSAVENSDINNSNANTTISVEDIKKRNAIEIPLNSAVYFYGDKNIFAIDNIIYPWDFLNAVKKILQNEVKQTVISPTASVSKSSVIEGPCIIDDGVIIDDFSKIKGPTYIGKNSLIGVNSLVRSSMIGKETRIGFNSEIAKSYLAGNDKISHLNLIMDTIIGEKVWFGGYSGTSNTTVTAKNIMYELDNGKTVDTGTDHFGAVIGNNCTIGTNVVILAGRKVPSNTVIQAIVKTYQVSSK